ncbi:hypothetical protein RJ640_004486 [Escallonia rubra]|uniref:F-box domain-containing protein n=1 Tax=Escallonia rubra TaxID=112253 RepID=A0AA88S2X4_9ASTE|nr:hypothetical protein RJ640_004486 [Escallonia rubra]
MDANARKKKSKDTKDRLGNLPEAVLGHILSLLPTKDAVRTSLLSKRWKYKWTLVTNLDFSDSLLYSGTKRKSRKMSFIEFVEKVLLLLGRSTIQKFFLSWSKDYDASRIQTWISSVIRRNVQCIKISCDGLCMENFVFPDLIYNQDSVAELKLRTRSCTFRLPHSVHFSSLIILDLRLVTFHNESHAELEELHITLPALNLLTLDKCKWLNTKTVHIDALALRVFIIEEDRDENATCQRVLKMRAPRLAKFRCRGSSSADVVFIGPSSIQDAVLGLDSCTYKYKVDIRSKMSEVACPLLRQLSRVELLTLGSGTIKHITPKKGGAEQGTLPQYTFPCLKVVKFNRFYGEDHELEFAKFLLKNAKFLEEITIATMGGREEIEDIKKRLLPYIRGSICSLIIVPGGLSRVEPFMYNF